jgi:hypothetical protein
MWCPLVSIAPAVRDGWVRVSGIDPKGMELAYGRGIFYHYAVAGTDALTVLDELIGAMNARKAAFAGWVRSVPISPETYMHGDLEADREVAHALASVILAGLPGVDADEQG